MSKTRLGRPLSFVLDLASFLPALAVFSSVVFTHHPAVALVLLLGNALTMAAVARLLRPSGDTRYFARLLPGALAYFVLSVVYALVFALALVWPTQWVLADASLLTALLISAVVFVLLLAPVRIWPAFGLTALLDQLRIVTPAYGVTATIQRSVDLAARLTAREDLFFPSGLLVSLALFVLTCAALAISEVAVPLPEDSRRMALLAYALVLAPLCQWLIARASFRAILGHRDLLRPQPQRHPPRPRTRPQQPVIVPVAVSARSSAALAETPMPAAPPTEKPIDAVEINARLLRHARASDSAAALQALAQGADANLVPASGDRDQRSVVVLACVAQDLALLRALIGKGADLNRVHAGLPPLIAATRDSYCGRPDVVMTLLTNGADPSCVDAERNTPLHFATRTAEPTVAALLCDASAPLDAVNHEGQTPLVIACTLGRTELVRFLLERRAQMDVPGAVPALVAAAASTDDNTDVIKMLLKRNARVDVRDHHGRAPLAIAAQHDNAHIAALLLKAGAAIDASDALGVTALMEAALAGATDALDVLGAHAPAFEAVDHSGRTALMFAAGSMAADETCVARLLELGASTQTATSEGKRAVDFAAAAGRWSVVALLDPDYVLPANVDTAARVSLAASREDSPAHLLDALRFGHWQIAEQFAEAQRLWPMAQRAQLFVDLCAHSEPSARTWLFDHGLDANVRLASGDTLVAALLAQLPTSLTALRETVDAGAQTAGSGLLEPLFAALLRHAERRDELETLALTMIDRGADVFGADAQQHAPLARSVAAGSLRLTEALLARGVDANARDRHGRSALFAVFTLPAARADALARALIRAGADPELAAANGETPLGLALALPQSGLQRWFDWGEWKLPKRALRGADLPSAALVGDVDAVTHLIELGLPVDALDDKGASALMRAAGAGRLAMVELLLDRGADIAQAASNGATPLSAAVMARRQPVVEALLKRGLDVDTRMPGGGTVLMIAAALGYPDLVAALLAHGADANAVDEHGTRPLHAAAQFAFAQRDTARARQTLELLIAKGAELDARDARGDSALHVLLGAHAEPRSVGDQHHLQALLSLFLLGRADVNLQDNRGVSPLHACAMHGLILPARALLAARADPEALDSMRRTPRDVAGLLGFVDVAAELTVRVPSSMPLPGQPAAQR